MQALRVAKGGPSGHYQRLSEHRDEPHGLALLHYNARRINQAFIKRGSEDWTQT